MTFDIHFPAILHGGDYNPDQWPEAVWDEDVRLMQEAHVNVATVPVFSWANLQPNEETYAFEWLDRIVDKLWKGGIHVCMATSTGSVPAWMDQKYPDILRVDREGRKQLHAGRHTFCPHSANYRRLSAALTEKLAERYGQHPALAVWHISNEFNADCWCEKCAAAFRVWLQKRYGSLDELNRCWYTNFWGHRYTDWSQIEPPSDLGEHAIQAMRVDYDRFQSESVLDCCKLERDAIRKNSPSVPITTNFMGAFKQIDYQKWASDLDIVSWDSYPQRGALPSDIAFSHSLMRGCKEGKPWMLMEQTPSQQNWQPYNSLKRPGILRLWSFQAMAHGADAVMYFQWRRGRGGCEKFHGAVVEHAGRNDARVFKEVSALGKELESLGKRTLGGRVESEAAVLFDWENWWVVEYSSGPSIDLKYVDQVRAYYKALYDSGISADVVRPEADLSKYKLIVAPLLYMIKPGVAEKLEKLVAGGATLVTTYFSGMADESDLVFDGGYPGPLTKLLGLRVEETDALSPAESNQAVFSESFGAMSGSYDCGLLCDRVHLEGAKALAHYGTEFYAGEPALTVNQFGNGKVYYAATMLDADALKLLVGRISSEVGIKPPLGTQAAGVEIISRKSDGGEVLTYVLNHNADARIVDLPAGSYKDLLTGADAAGKLEMPRYGVAILVKC